MTKHRDQLRHNWELEEISTLYQLPFNDLLFQAHTLHREYHNPNAVQISTLMSIKTGACPEDCAYCPQSAHHNSGLNTERLLPLNEVVERARAAKSQGATRFCMGAAWRSPTDKNLGKVIDMIKAVKNEGLETCVTLGMLKAHQAKSLKQAGLDYYNHNLDTSPDYYNKIITTRDYQDRLDTLKHVADVDINLCCGGILGMGESVEDRVALLQQLANLPKHPKSVPINMLVQVKGTPLYGSETLDLIEFIRTVAVARILMPRSYVRLSAGRESMSAEAQALCFFAGANSIFYGEKLLTTSNPSTEQDKALFESLGIQALDDVSAQRSNTMA